MVETVSAKSSEDKCRLDFLTINRHLTAGAWEHYINGHAHSHKESEVRKGGDTRTNRGLS